jgi:hypothetical protein
MNKPAFGARDVQRVVLRAGGLWTLKDIAHFTGTARARQWAYECEDFPEPANRNMLGHRLFTGWEVIAWLDATGRLAQARDMKDAIIRWRLRSKAPGRPPRAKRLDP